eukprot:COSAG01_NODE_4036_length_5414_cov_56.799812_7_plen_48_part_00
MMAGGMAWFPTHQAEIDRPSRRAGGGGGGPCTMHAAYGPPERIVLEY